MSEAARELLQGLVEKTNPYAHDTQPHHHDRCVYCGAVWDYGTSSKEDLDPHLESCIWCRAKRYLQHRPRNGRSPYDAGDTSRIQRLRSAWNRRLWPF